MRCSLLQNGRDTSSPPRTPLPEYRLPKPRILDVLLLVTLLALHFASYRIESTQGPTSVNGLLFLTPTLVASWILFRSGISIPAAALWHYVLSIGWVFCHTYCTDLAYNARREAHGENRQIAAFPDAIGEATDMTLWAIPLSATFAIICYSAISHHRKPTLPPMQEHEDG